MNRILFTTFYTFCLLPLLAQVDTSVVIDEIIINSNLIREESNSFDLQNNKSISNSSLVKSLQTSDNVYIKNYGDGSLSTLSIRGGSAGQSLVLWNGLPLQSPMLGLLDLSLIPNGVTESMEISKGGNTTLWGSGAISGILNLKSNPHQDYTIHNTTTIGSFGLFTENIAIKLQEKKWTSISKYIHESSNRDFEYNVTPQIIIKQSNARYNRNHFLQDFYFNAKEKHKFSAHIWYYNASTMIPPTNVQNRSFAFQDDSALRANISWKLIGKSWIASTKIGFFRDHNDFFDPSILLEALNDFSSTFADVNIQKQKGNHTLSIGSTASYTKATSQGYQGSQDEHKVALFAVHKWSLPQLTLKSSVRQEMVDTHLAPFLPNIEVNYLPSKYLSSHLRLSRDFRYPTLNDRYWIPGGNPNLQPENGWSAEMGIKFHKKADRFHFGYKITGFYRDIKNWILWSPGKNVSFWAAQNINNVISQGIEQHLKLEYISNHLTIGFNAQYDYISSAFQSDLAVPRVKAGDQLLYIPKHNTNGSFYVNAKDIALEYNHQISSSSRGVNENISSFQTGSIKLRYQTEFKKTQYSLFATINNLWDESYFIIERRPMAGRNYSIGLSFKH